MDMTAVRGPYIDMKFIIQRVQSAEVTVVEDSGIKETPVGSVERGFMVLVGVSGSDDKAVADKMVSKMLSLRIFEDDNNRTNLSLADVGGGLLLVSQFTLLADCRKGNRPSFTKAGSAEHAKTLFEYVAQKCLDAGYRTECGIFGAHMKVSLVNAGPFTIILDSDELSRPRHS